MSEKPIKKIKKQKHKTSGTAVACIFAGLFLFICIAGVLIIRIITGTPAPALNETKPAYIGHNGSGTIVEGFCPEQRLFDAIDAKIATNEKEGRSAALLHKVKNDIVCGFDRSTGLSNGDVITYACTVDINMARDAGLKITDTQKSYRVEGLPAVTNIDPFQNMTHSWDMNGDEATLQIIPNPSIDTSLITYTVEQDPESGLYRIHAKADEENLLKAGIRLTATETTYDPGPAPQKIQRARELSKEEEQILYEKASTLLQAELETCGNTLQGQDDTITVTDFTPDGIRGRSGELEVEFKLTTEGSRWANNPFSTTKATYTGSVWRTSDGIAFLSDTAHTCTVTGPFGIYNMEEAS